MIDVIEVSLREKQGLSKIIFQDFVLKDYIS